ncbi:hypothetical protein [Streptomyces sp. NPDC058812]|uniref:NucA/NucB deoxyribonuclease domain-containing protein n=1 Tax=unclassified Streptomyces TaxID=2593676 RepID=UPI003695BCF6
MTSLRLKAAFTGLAAAALLLVGALPAQAQSPQEDRKTTYKITPYVISDPALIADPEKLVEEVTKRGNLDRLGIKPSTSAGPSQMSKKAALAADPASYVVDSSRFPNGRIPADIYDYTNWEECGANSDAASQDAGWIKNRYSYCQKHLLFMPAFECGLFPPQCKISGVYSSTNTLIGYGKVGGHEDHPNFRWADFRLKVENIVTTGPFAGSGADLSAAIECEGTYTDEDSNLNDDHACYAHENEETEKTINEWRVNDEAYFDIASQAISSDPLWGEQIATGVFHIEYEFDLPWYFQIIDTESPEGGMRFDSAWYLQSHKLGSVFDRAVPGMSYTKSDAEVAGVAIHLEDARANPGATMPTQADKHLAGGTPGDPIHRLAQAKGEKQSFRYDENRRIVRNFCATKAMQDLKATLPENQGPYDCDEYPMASTYEGAGRHLFPNEPYGGAQYERHYSARWVNSEVNQEAGRRLGRWYDVDRLLDQDAFHIPIR